MDVPVKKPEHMGRGRDFLKQHLPELKDPKNLIPQFNPKGQIGQEVENLDETAYMLYGPPVQKVRKTDEDYHLEKLTNQIEIYKQIDMDYYNDLTRQKSSAAKVITYR